MRLLRYATGNSQFREPILIYVEGYNMSTSLFLAVLSIHFVFLNASSQVCNWYLTIQRTDIDSC